jgi:hypothetical protein
LSPSFNITQYFVIVGCKKKNPYLIGRSFGFMFLGNLLTQIVLESITARQHFFRELELFVRLILRSHPSADALIQQNVFGVKSFKFGVFRRP